MSTQKNIWKSVKYVLLFSIFAAAYGCGQIADKDRIRIAKIGERYLTRGDLFKLIRETPDAERPIIRNRGDLLRILNEHLDTRIKLPLGKKLASEGKVSIPREFAREQFFHESGDLEMQLRAMWQMEVPESGVITPMMQLYGLTPELLQFNKDNIEEGTDQMVAKLQGDQAVEVLALEALKDGRIKIEESEIQRDYEFMKEQLSTFETLLFLAIRFPEEMKDASGMAAAVKARIDAGESFDDLIAEYKEKGRQEGKDYVFQSEIMNNPTLTRFRGFWAAASGAMPGSIVGPVYLPAYQQVAQDRTGQTRSMEMPAVYLVFKVLEQKPSGVLEYEKARPLVLRPLLIAKMMHLLRDEHGVEVYPEKLPEPTQFQGSATIL